MKCLICQKLVEGYFLAFMGEAICGKCEAQLMQLKVNDAEYELQINAFKSLWQKEFSTRSNHHLVDGECL